MAAHQPVLLTETIELLGLRRGDVVIDATCGAGGHTERLAEEVGAAGRVIAIDRDEAALSIAQERLRQFKQVSFSHRDFRDLAQVLRGFGIEGAHGILADLGLSSMQLDDRARGFSFFSEGELDMRMDRRVGETAADLLRSLSEAKLGHIFREYGEERRWRSVARAVVAHRERGGRFSGPELQRLAHRAIGAARSGRVDSATRVFHALRIAVNDELGALEEFLDSAVSSLLPRGRLAVISFHSLEDRIVKNRFRREASGCLCPPELPRCVCGHQPSLRVLTRKPVRSGEDEVRGNSRARSARATRLSGSPTRTPIMRLSRRCSWR